MEYGVDQLSKLSGVSARALRHYEQLGLLSPGRRDANGYRVYGEAEVVRLQQILLYRELGVPLAEIGRILCAKDFDVAAALQSHLAALREKRARTDALIKNVERTIQSMKGDTVMTDEEKFEGFKRKLIDENEAKYGKEIREKYGEEAVERSNARVRGMSRERHAAQERLSAELNEALKAACETGDPAGETAQKAAALHKEWLCFYWDQYSKEAHRGLAEMYVEDPRFAAYYDGIAPGLAAFLRDAIRIFCKE